MQYIKWKVLTRTKHKIWRKEKLLQNGRTREDFMEELAYKGLLKIDSNLTFEKGETAMQRK